MGAFGGLDYLAPEAQLSMQNQKEQSPDEAFSSYVWITGLILYQSLRGTDIPPNFSLSKAKNDIHTMNWLKNVQSPHQQANMKKLFGWIPKVLKMCLQSKWKKRSTLYEVRDE